MEEVGVTAIVKGLQSFLGDMSAIQGSINSLAPSSNLVTNILGSLGNGIGWLGQQVVDIAKYALGGLLKDAIEGAIQLIKDLTLAAFESGEEFQSLTIRLNGINLNELIDSFGSYEEAVAASIALTQEQLDWLQILAVTTPFDVSQIANVYTMARAFGFTDEAARELTISISDFAAGMGLGNEEIQRIIINFGQMIQRGKITAREMNDLARGALVPLSDILERVASNMGISTEELSKLISTADGVPAEEFIKAFEEMTSEEERFAGASQRMAHTFAGSIANLKDLATSFGGRQIMQPILDVLGGWIGGFLDLFAVMDETGPHFPKLGEDLKSAFGAIGQEIVNILNQVFGSLPSQENLAEGLVGALQNFARWLAEHQQDIVDFFVNIVDTIKNDIIPFIVDKLIPAFASFIGWIVDHSDEIFGIFESIGKFIAETVIPAFQTLGKWIADNQPLIDEFFGAILSIVKDVISNLLGKPVGEGGFLESVKTFMQWVIDNQDAIATWVEIFIRLYVIVQVVSFVFQILVSAIIGVITFVISLISSLALLGVYFLTLSGEVGKGWGSVVEKTKDALGQIGDTLTRIWEDVKTFWNNLVQGFSDTWSQIKQGVSDSWAELTSDLSEAWETIRQRASEAWENIKSSLSNWWEEIKAKAAEVWESIKSKVKETWDKIVADTKTFWTNFTTILSQLWTIIQYYWTNFWNFITAKATSIWQVVSTKFTEIRDTIIQKIQEAIHNVLSIDWGEVGWSIVQGMIDGVLSGAASLIGTIVNVAVSAYNAALAAIGAGSPSRLFMDWGKFTMQGMAIGIQKYAGLVVGTMQNAVSQIAAPAMALPAITQSITAAPASVSSSYATTNYFTQNVNTSAPREPIIADFQLMQSLAGA